MKKFFSIILLLSGLLFAVTSCDTNAPTHTGDTTGDLYGIWRLEKRIDVAS